MIVNTKASNSANEKIELQIRLISSDLNMILELKQEIITENQYNQSNLWFIFSICGIAETMVQLALISLIKNDFFNQWHIRLF